MKAVLPAAVCREWFGDLSGLRVERISGGFSGATVYRCEGPQGTVALRQWPSGTRAQRIEEIHQVLRTAYARGCRAVPQLISTRNGASLLAVGARCWDCSTWTPGQPWREGISPLRAIDAIREGCQAIARFHESVGELGSRRGPAPAVQTRWRRLAEVEAWLAEPLRYQMSTDAFARTPRRESPLPTWLPRAERLLKAIWESRGGQLRDRLRHYLQESFPLQYVLRDVHREHVLFDGQRFSGLIDFDAVRVDSPAADVARFVSSFLDASPPTASPPTGMPPTGKLSKAGNGTAEQWHEPFVRPLWAAAMAGYRDERPFSDQELQLAKFLAEIGPFLSLTNWAVWNTSQPQPFASSADAIAARTEHLSRCLHLTFDIG